MKNKAHYVRLLHKYQKQGNNDGIKAIKEVLESEEIQAKLGDFNE